MFGLVEVDKVSAQSESFLWAILVVGFSTACARLVPYCCDLYGCTLFCMFQNNEQTESSLCCASNCSAVIWMPLLYKEKLKIGHQQSFEVLWCKPDCSNCSNYLWCWIPVYPDHKIHISVIAQWGTMWEVYTRPQQKPVQNKFFTLAVNCTSVDYISRQRWTNFTTEWFATLEVNIASWIRSVCLCS